MVVVAGCGGCVWGDGGGGGVRWWWWWRYVCFFFLLFFFAEGAPRQGLPRVVGGKWTGMGKGDGKVKGT